MIYACENCTFLFERKGEVELCPVCEKSKIRAATKDEEAKYFKDTNKSGDTENMKP